MTARRKASPIMIKLYICVAFLIVGAILLCLTELQLRPVLMNLAEYRGKQIITDIIYEETNRILKEEKISYENLSYVAYLPDGMVSSVETNTVMVNILQSKLIAAINSRMSSLSKETLEIPAGTVSGLAILHGVGPKIKVRITPAGNVNCDIRHEFISAGINQTCHRLYFVVSTGAKAVIPAYSDEFSVEASCLLVETIIVGEAPNGFYSFAS